MELSYWYFGLVLLFTFGTCKGFHLYGEEKRQGLIPFPRVGRSPYSSHTGLSDDEESSSSNDDDLLEGGGIPLRYSRAMFSPRLGRKKRSAESAMLDDKSTDNEIEEMKEILQSSPWAILALKDSGIDKKALTAFSPRLGRAMIPRLGKKSESDNYSDFYKRAVSAFSPRLGRANLAFSPRLGRAMERSVAFSPRLGRSVNAEEAKNEQTNSRV